MTPTGDAALHLAARGVPVFPLHTPVEGGCSCREECGKNAGKHPRLKHGLSEATTDLDVVKRWWTKWPDANIGACAGPEAGFWVLDIDAGTPGETWLAEQQAALGTLPATRRARTGGGGCHYFFRFDSRVLDWLNAHHMDLPSRNGVRPNVAGVAGVGEGVKGIDVKAAGGYLVMPPSVHRFGPSYEWTDERSTAYAPEWLLLAVGRPRPATRPATLPAAPVATDSNERKWGLTVLRNACATIAQSEHTHDLTRARARLIGGIVAGGYLTRAEAEAALVEAAVASGRTEKEATRTVRWGLDKGAESPVAKPPSRWEQRAGASWGKSPSAPVAPAPVEAPIPDPPDLEDGPPPYDGEEDGGGGRRDNAPNMTDVGNRVLLVRLHGENLRWCGAIPGDGWLVWDGRRWQTDDVRQSMRLASELGEWWRERANGMFDPHEARKTHKWAAITESVNRIKGCLELTKADPAIGVRRDQLDADPMLFNTPNLTLDLRAPAAYEPRRSDLITRLAGTPALEGAECPTWLAFLHTIMDGDQTLIDFLQRAVGYSLTGDVSEQCLFILHGNGANGKSTFIETIRHIMGDYAKNTPIETFTMRREGGIPNDLAALAGARFVTAAESQEGMALNEALVKQATGEEAISARFLNREFFDYAPLFHVWLSLNHKPVVRGTDEGIWRRLRLVPFNVTIPKEKRDRQLRAKLEAEAAGILMWAIQGCGWWRQIGLAPPPAVMEATDAYRHEMDVVKAWIDDCCEVGPTCGPTPVRDLYRSYQEWAKDQGTHPKSAKWFGQQLTLKRCKEAPGHAEGRRREGIKLMVSNTPRGMFPENRDRY